MENSIEEDIKIAERFIKSIKTDKEYKKEGWHGYFNEEIVELARILEHILSDYKRVLKENEELKNDYENLSNSVVVKNYYIKNSIPVQKVKDMIEELKENGYWNYLEERDLETTIEILKKLLESEE